MCVSQSVACGRGTGNGQCCRFWCGRVTLRGVDEGIGEGLQSVLGLRLADRAAIDVRINSYFSHERKSVRIVRFMFARQKWATGRYGGEYSRFCNLGWRRRSRRL